MVHIETERKLNANQEEKKSLLDNSLALLPYLYFDSPSLSSSSYCFKRWGIVYLLFTELKSKSLFGKPLAFYLG